MNMRMFIKLIFLGTLIVLLGNWLKGHDVLTGIVLTTTFLLVSAKIIFALIHRRGSGPGDVPLYPPYAPIPRPPVRPRPPELTGYNRR
jgi:hypothetical protein